MGNHYHLLLETPDGNLSLGMRHLNGVYTQGYNRRHRRVGHVFQGRFKAIVVERDSYLLELCRYVVLNPVRAGIVESPEQYLWSSYRATAGLAEAPDVLTTDWVLQQLSGSRSAAQRSYVAFVLDGIGASSPWSEVKGQVLLGSDGFVQRLRSKFDDARGLQEVPRRQRFVNRPALNVIFAQGKAWAPEERNRLVRLAHIEHGYTLTEIAAALGLHYTSISKILNAQARKGHPRSSNARSKDSQL
jgi:hypothetical protein